MLQIGARLWQLPGQFQARAIEHAAALPDFSEQAISIGIEHHLHLGIGLTQGSSQQALGENQGIIGLIKQHRAAKDALVLRGIGGCRMLKAHLGRRNIQPGNPMAKGHPAGHGFLAQLTFLLGQQGLPAMCHLWLQPFTWRLVGQINLSQITHQRGVTRLAMQGIREGRAAHDQIPKHPVVTRPHRFAQVQAQLLVAGQLHTMAEQLQVSAGSHALIALGQDLRAELHALKQRVRIEPLTGEVVEQPLQVGD